MQYFFSLSDLVLISEEYPKGIGPRIEPGSNLAADRCAELRHNKLRHLRTWIKAVVFDHDRHDGLQSCSQAGSTGNPR